MSSFDFNIFVGTENGIFKGVNTKSSCFKNLNNIENLSKEKEILKMCWRDESAQDSVLFGTRDKHVVGFDYKVGEKEMYFSDLGELDLGEGILKSLEQIGEDKFMTCVESGSLKIWSLAENKMNQISHISVGRDINCAAKYRLQGQSGSVLIATGGNENDLKIWTPDGKKEALFKAKNVPDNWMQLREPVWVKSIGFINENKVALGTAYHQIRVYDIRGTSRRPVFNLNYGQHPVNTICSVPEDENRLVVANTRGDMESIDLRMANNKNNQCIILKKYQNFHGSIKSIKICKSPVFGPNRGQFVASCGLDRFLRVHELDSGVLVSKIYLKSRLNDLLFSRHNLNEKQKKPRQSEADDEDELESKLEDSGTEDLWSDMEIVVDKADSFKTKRNKTEKSESSDTDNDEKKIVKIKTSKPSKKKIKTKQT